VTHPLVEQLRFARYEFRRALRGFPDADGRKRFGPMNSAGWIVGHMAWHEQRYWLERLAGEGVEPELASVANGAPASTPSLKRMLAAWKHVTAEADPGLDALDEASMAGTLPGQPPRQMGNAILRVTYHYWFHTGEIVAIRQLLENPTRPEYVGDIDGRAPYRPVATR
jgi:hypothetical protein